MYTKQQTHMLEAGAAALGAKFLTNSWVVAAAAGAGTYYWLCYAGPPKKSSDEVEHPGDGNIKLVDPLVSNLPPNVPPEFRNGLIIPTPDNRAPATVAIYRPKPVFYPLPDYYKPPVKPAPINPWGKVATSTVDGGTNHQGFWRYRGAIA